MVAELNDYIDDEGTNHGIPNKPTDRYSPNGLARVTPKSNRGAASEEYAVWVKGNIGTREITALSAIKDGSAGWTAGTYMLFTDGTTDGYIWFRHDGAGADPAPNANDLGMINVIAGDSTSVIVNKLYRVFLALADTEVCMTGVDSITVRNRLPGARTDATAGTLTDTVITVAVEDQGVDAVATAWDGTFTDPIDGAQNLVYADE